MGKKLGQKQGILRNPGETKVWIFKMAENTYIEMQDVHFTTVF